ncbi:MAG: hypothetical protein JXB38_21110, partial [Anaerolineales bacterium]|nr:hypothetical protein [Anaerolineales bacterium]
PGVDAVFVGPYDLSGSLGVLGQLQHPAVQAGVCRVLEAAQAAGVAAGLHIADPEPGEVQQRIAEGFRLIGVGLDSNILRKGAQQLANAGKVSGGKG